MAAKGDRATWQPVPCVCKWRFLWPFPSIWQLQCAPAACIMKACPFLDQGSRPMKRLLVSVVVSTFAVSAFAQFGNAAPTGGWNVVPPSPAPTGIGGPAAGAQGAGAGAGAGGAAGAGSAAGAGAAGAGAAGAAAAGGIGVGAAAAAAGVAAAAAVGVAVASSSSSNSNNNTVATGGSVSTGN